VVCQFGRNNVPLCQEDGTWTDIPRCIEHDPGVEDQIPGLCPAIPGYCAQNFLNGQCLFDCPTGQDISSVCTADGTWNPYPTCEGDLRETRDGCDGCPGALGGRRNRTAEAILGTHRDVDSRRVPKLISNDGGRKTVPSFAGNINIVHIRPQDESPIFINQNSNAVTSLGRKGDQHNPQLKSGRPTKATRVRKFKQIQPPPSFGVFEAVSLGRFGAAREKPIQVARHLPTEEDSVKDENFFGIFESVNL